MENKIRPILEKKAGKFNVRRLVLLVLGLGIIITVAWGAFTATIESNNCKPADGFAYVSNVMAKNPETEEQIYIARAVISTGSPIASDKQIKWPTCTTKDASLMSVRNLYVVIDGKVSYLASGVIGLGTGPLAVVTQP